MFIYQVYLGLKYKYVLKKMKSIGTKVRASVTAMLVFLQGLGFSSGLCTGNLCFDWTAYRDRLILSCRIDRPNFRVLIRDPNGITQGDCLPLHPNALCESHFKNATLSLNYTTNIAMFEVRGKIDPSVNGVWTCTHGIGYQLAQCNVNISKPEDGCKNYYNNSIIAKRNETMYVFDCQRNILIFSFGGYMVVVMLLMPVCAYREQICNKGNNCFFFKTTNKSLGSKHITICRIIAFISFSCLFFFLCWFSKSFIKGICQFSHNDKWVLTIIGVLMGIAISVLCLTKVTNYDEDIELQSRRQDDMEPQRELEDDMEPQRALGVELLPLSVSQEYNESKDL